MQTIMVVLLEESEDVREDLLFSILSILGRNKSVSTFNYAGICTGVFRYYMLHNTVLPLC